MYKATLTKYDQPVIVLADGGYRGTSYVMVHQLFKLYPLHRHG